MPVYMIRAGESGPVRIHYSGTGADRTLQDGQAWSAADLRIVREIDAGWSTASRIRQYYAAQLIRDEWFVWSDDMLNDDKSVWFPLSEKHQAILDRLVAGGVTMADIAREYDLSRERVRQIAAKGGHDANSLGTRALANHGIVAARKAAIEERKKDRLDRKAARIASVLRLDDNGYSQQQIGERLSIHQPTVSRILVANGRRTRSLRGTRKAASVTRTAVRRGTRNTASVPPVVEGSEP